MTVHGIKDTFRPSSSSSSTRGRSVSVSWNNTTGVESSSPSCPSPSSLRAVRERGSMRRKISNGLNGLGWGYGYDGSDSSGAGGGSDEDGNDGSQQQRQQQVSTPKRIGSMGSLAATTTTTPGTGSGDGRQQQHVRLGTMACEVQPLLLGSLDLTLRNLGVGLGEGLGGVGFAGGVTSTPTAAAANGGGRSSRRTSMQYQSW